MKRILTAVLLTVTLSACGYQSQSHVQSEEATSLDGKKFCRTVKTGGVLGQPTGEREHCVSFKDGKMTDNANTFFGNPPETLKYKLDGDKVLASRDGKWVKEYTVKDDTIANDAGAVLNLVVSLDGKKFCRTVKTGGVLGQPAAEREHCVSFKDGKMTDNANTFFGNPPETLPYKLDGDKIFTDKKGKWTKAYTVKDDTIVNEAGAVLDLVKE